MEDFYLYYVIRSKSTFARMYELLYLVWEIFEKGLFEFYDFVDLIDVEIDSLSEGLLFAP